MTYEVIELEHRDVLATYDSLDTAKQRLGEFLEQSPEREDELAIATPATELRVGAGPA